MKLSKVLLAAAFILGSMFCGISAGRWRSLRRYRRRYCRILSGFRYSHLTVVREYKHNGYRHQSNRSERWNEEWLKSQWMRDLQRLVSDELKRREHRLPNDYGLLTTDVNSPHEAANSGTERGWSPPASRSIEARCN